jgi:protein-S-isoprenylcysteine O-methyltransferase Ste14
MKWLDLPPIWLGLAVLAMWFEVQRTGGVDLPGWLHTTGWLIIGAGLAVAVLALGAFTTAKTSPIPHTQPSAIITTGLYGLSRNPIYLADAIMLFGASLVMGAASILVLLPGFILLIDRRFIRAEEARLAAVFPEEWEAYRLRVRRWL